MANQRRSNTFSRSGTVLVTPGCYEFAG